MSPAEPSRAERVEAALHHLVEWWTHCLNIRNPDPLARSQPSDDDLCELFNRLEIARRALGPVLPPRPGARQ